MKGCQLIPTAIQLTSHKINKSEKYEFEPEKTI